MFSKYNTRGVKKFSKYNTRGVKSLVNIIQEELNV